MAVRFANIDARQGRSGCVQGRSGVISRCRLDPDYMEQRLRGAGFEDRQLGPALLTGAPREHDQGEVG